MENPKIRRVISFQPTFLKFIQDAKTINLINDKNINPIIKLLQKNHMTVKELEVAYEEMTEKKKSNKTIYRYLKTLEDAGLVVPAGNLVTTGKTATETIFARTALAFYMKEDENQFWYTDKASRIAKNVGLLLKPLFNNNEPNIDALMELMKEQSSISQSTLEDLVKEVGDDIISSIKDCDLEEINYILKYTALFSSLMKNRDLIEKLHHCF